MKKQKSLRALARELGVSHSYLSQVRHGKRPASGKIQEALDMVSMVSKSEANSGLKIRRTLSLWVRVPPPAPTQV